MISERECAFCICLCRLHFPTSTHLLAGYRRDHDGSLMGSFELAAKVGVVAGLLVGANAAAAASIGLQSR